MTKTNRGSSGLVNSKNLNLQESQYYPAKL